MAASLLTLLLASVTMVTARSVCEIFPSCEDGWTQFGSHCYKFYNQKSSWQDAENACQFVGAHLASVHSQDENDFLYNLIFAKTRYNRVTWLGGRNTESDATWFWSDGSQWDFDLWYPGQPDNHKGREHHLFTNFMRAKTWGDYPQYYHLTYICAKKLI